MRYRKSGLCLLRFLIGCVLAPRVGSAQEPLPVLEDYQLRVFTVADGLPASDIRVVGQDEAGYLYAGGGRGLARYDGRRFEPVPLVGFRSDRLDWMVRDPLGRLWVGNRDGDLGFLVGDHVEAVRGLPAGPYAFPCRWSFTSDGGLWLGTRAGLILVRPDGEPPWPVYTTADGLPPDSVLGLLALPDGERIALTRHRLARAEPVGGQRDSLTFVPLGPTVGPYEVLVPRGLYSRVLVDDAGVWLYWSEGLVRYRDGRVWAIRGPTAGVRTAGLRAGTDARAPGAYAAASIAEVPGGTTLTGQFAFRLDPPRKRLPSPAPLIQRVLYAHDGARWIAVGGASDRLPYILREGAHRVERLEVGRQLEFRVTNDAVEDHEGGIWIGTDLGLIQISPRPVAALTARQGLAETFTTAVLQTRDGDVWIGTMGGGVHRYHDGRLLRRYTKADGLPDDRVRGLYDAEDGAVWVGTYLGFAEVGSEGDVRSVVMSPQHERAFAETTGPDGRMVLWEGGGRGLRARPRGAGAFEFYRPDVHWGQIWTLHAARDGALWVGSDAGLFRVVGDSVTSFGPAEGFTGGFAVSIYEESDGTLWIGTYADGLFRYREGRFAQVSTRQGLYHNGVWQILDDGRGGYWISSDGGIFRVNRKRLHAVADAVEAGAAPVRLLRPLVFTEPEGMPSREGNRGFPAGWRLADGRLLFNNIAGAVVIDPERAISPPPAPPMVIQSVVADGKEVERPSGGAAARLPAGTRHVTFDFAALSFATPEQTHYRYRLDGYDDDWISGGSERQASYTGLHPGRYTFRVEGATGVGDWSEDAATRALILPPLLWQTWWFRVLVLMTVATMVVAAYRWRVARLVEIERFRLRVASDLHDDVGSNLSSIALASEMLYDRARVAGLERKQLERIRSAAGETIGALREIIWLVDPKHDNLRDFLTRMRGTASDMLNGTPLRFRGPEHAPDRALDPAFVRQTFLIYKEALHNLVKHADAGLVTVDVQVESDVLRLCVEDDGAGFDVDGSEGTRGSGSGAGDEDERGSAEAHETDEGETSSGLGLASMRRRAADLGGELRIDSVPGRGTRITLEVRMA